MEHDDHTFSTDSAAGGLMSGRYVFLTERSTAGQPPKRVARLPELSGVHGLRDRHDVDLYRSQPDAAQLDHERAGPHLDAVKPGFQCVKTRWNQGFTAIRPAPPAPIVILMVPACPESGSPRVTPSPGPSAKWHWAIG